MARKRKKEHDHVYFEIKYKLYQMLARKIRPKKVGAVGLEKTKKEIIGLLKERLKYAFD